MIFKHVLFCLTIYRCYRSFQKLYFANNVVQTIYFILYENCRNFWSIQAISPSNYARSNVKCDHVAMKDRPTENDIALAISIHSQVALLL